MGSTPVYNLPFPELSDPADGPDGYKDLAERIEAVLQTIAAVPTGVISPFAGSAPPSGWLLCDGGAVSRSTYAALFAVVGTSYGAGDGTTTFNKPNLRGRTPIMFDAAQAEFDAFGEAGGEKVHVLSLAEVAAHSHVVASHSHGGGYHDHGTYTGTETADHSHSGTTDTQGTHSHGTASGAPFAVDALINAAATGTARNSVVGEEGNTGNAGAHAHNFGTGGRSAAHQHAITAQSVVNAEAPGTNAQGGGAAHNNLPPYVVVNFVIKS